MQTADTHPTVQELLDDHHRRMSPLAKAEALAEAWCVARSFQLAGLRLQHPAASDTELEELLAERRLGSEAFEKASRATRL